MKWRSWDSLPGFMKCDEVKAYYDLLSKKRIQLNVKRAFDVVTAIILLFFLAIPMSIIAVLIKLDSPGPVFFLQERVTAYGKKFKIHKFRTMVDHADKIGPTITVGGDDRITKLGSMLRKLCIDELPQLIDVLSGNMSFVGTRPEETKYVRHYTKEMYATLLLPAGITSEASIRYLNEAALLDAADNVDKIYLEKILPQKMKYNLQSIKKFNLWNEIVTIFKTVLAVLGNDADQKW